MALEQIISENCIIELVSSSRIHKVERYFTGSSVFMKRDDELGFGIAGSKVRKFASILKAIEYRKPEFVVIEGGLNSNNVLGLSALLNSYNLKTKIAVAKSHSPQIGNSLWTRAINKENIFEIETTGGRPLEYYQSLLKAKDIYIVREGACQLDAIPGLLTLGKEIDQYEKKHNMAFDQLYIDSGTGITAIATYIALQLQGRNPQYFITLIAVSEPDFVRMAEHLTHQFNERFSTNLNLNLNDFTFLKPPTSKSFGSVNSTISAEWNLMMESLGFPVDLTYTAKHFYAIKRLLENGEKNGPKLIVNCGSWLSARNHENLLSKNHNKKD